MKDDTKFISTLIEECLQEGGVTVKSAHPIKEGFYNACPFNNRAVGQCPNCEREIYPGQFGTNETIYICKIAGDEDARNK